VAGCRERLQREGAQIHGVSVVEHGVGESARAGLGCKHCGTFGVFQLAHTGDDVRVQVGFRGVSDGQPQPPSLRTHLAEVAFRVHHQRPPSSDVQQVGGVTQPLVDDWNKMQRCHVHALLGSNDPPRGGKIVIP
jgi:hypothetical protein